MQKQQSVQAPHKGWKTLLAALLATGALAACNDSGGSSNGNGDDDDGNGNGASNGNGDTVTEVTDADSVFVYMSTNMNTLEQELFAVDAEDPNARSAVTPTPQYNRANRDSASSAWQGETFTSPDDSNVPLGVLGGDFSNGELTNAGYHYTVFNTPDGELYRLDAASGDTTAERFSSEDDASIICASFVAPDLADIDNSRLVYQVAKNTSCEDTQIRMARIGDDETGEVVTLHADVEWELSFQDVSDPFFAEMGGWLTDSDGALVEVLTFDGDEILAYNLASDSSTTLVSDSNHFAVLGYTDNGDTLIFAGDGGDVKAYSPGGTVETLQLGASEWSPSRQYNQSHTIVADGKLYVVDAGQNAVLEVDGTEITPIDDDWSSSSLPNNVTAANGFLAFAYWTGSDWNIRQVALDGGSATNLVTNVRASFPINSPKAPGSNDSYWFLYTDFGDQDDDPVARGVEFTTGGGEFSINDALWRGETWSRTMGETGYQAEFLMYQESDQTGDLFSLDASDPASSSGQNMEVGGLTWDIWVSGFGPQTLMVGREDQTLQTNRPEVLFIDASDSGSAVRLTDETGVDHRPLPFY